jgi:hypothetical protein
MVAALLIVLMMQTSLGRGLATEKMFASCEPQVARHCCG